MHTSTFCFHVGSWFNIFEGLACTINLDIGITNNIHKHHCYVRICTSSAAPSCLANGDEMHHSKHILTSEIITHGSGGRVYTSDLTEYSIWDINKFSFNLFKKKHFQRWTPEIPPIPGYACCSSTERWIHSALPSEARFHQKNVAEQPGSLLDFSAQPGNSLT